MTRKDLYNEIKTLGLTEECKKVYGKNMTNCTTAALETLIMNHKSKKARKEREAKIDKAIDNFLDGKSVNFVKKPACLGAIDKGAREAIKAIANILNIKDIENYFNV